MSLNELSDAELKTLLENKENEQELFDKADAVRRQRYGKDVYIRGLIELSNYCKNNCYYCGIRLGNNKLERYRLDKQQVLECAKQGYELGFRTFVMQGGEDPHYTDSFICETVNDIKNIYPDCAISLSLGEKTYESLKAYFDAGADRYLLRHETACEDHYRKLHPKNLNLTTRKKCLFDIKSIGYEVGTGLMVGSPYQTTEHLVKDLRFMQELQPDMIGIGPFLSHKDTPFCHHKNGDMYLCLRMVAILRLMFPHSLIPATTALATISNLGRELALKAGANVIMPNLSPLKLRKLYLLYDDKVATNEEAAESLALLREKVKSLGYCIVVSKGGVIK